MCKLLLLCDVINRRHNTFFCDFLTFQCNTEGKKKKDEKKHHAVVDESSPEQQLYKSDAITFVV